VNRISDLDATRSREGHVLEDPAVLEEETEMEDADERVRFNGLVYKVDCLGPDSSGTGRKSDSWHGGGVTVIFGEEFSLTDARFREFVAFWRATFRSVWRLFCGKSVFSLM
jgi:hypothetical protein